MSSIEDIDPETPKFEAGINRRLGNLKVLKRTILVKKGRGHACVEFVDGTAKWFQYRFGEISESTSYAHV